MEIIHDFGKNSFSRIMKDEANFHYIEVLNEISES